MGFLDTYNSVLQEPLSIAGGVVRLEDKPGIGVELDAGFVKAHREAQSNWLRILTSVWPIPAPKVSRLVRRLICRQHKLRSCSGRHSGHPLTRSSSHAPKGCPVLVTPAADPCILTEIPYQQPCLFSSQHTDRAASFSWECAPSPVWLVTSSLPASLAASSSSLCRRRRPSPLRPPSPPTSTKRMRSKTAPGARSVQWPVLAGSVLVSA